MNESILKSGSWIYVERYARSAYRGASVSSDGDGDGDGDSDVGLRLGLDIVQPNRILKSGSWFSLGWQIRSARRNHNDPDFRLRLFGLRLALDGTKKSPAPESGRGKP